MTESRTFCIVDDNHPNFYVARFTRTKAEVKPELWSLGIGAYLDIGNGRAFSREK